MFTLEEKKVLSQASAILAAKLRTNETLSNPELVKELCIYKLARYEIEIFAALMLDNQHRLIKFVELSHGTINSASVYPREIVKSVLEYNAQAVIFAHNHPSGIAEPSLADRHITERLTQALSTIDVKVLDHIVVGAIDTISFAERGWL